MPNYNEESVSGTRWTRCREIHIQNPHSSRGVPSVTFVEEDIVNMDGNYLVLPKDYSIIPTINTVIFDPDATIDMYDPITGQPTGSTTTMRDIYITLFSAYMTQAKKRDSDSNNPTP